MKPLENFARDVGAPVLVLHDDASAEAVAAGHQDWEVHPITGPLPEPRRWAGVALVVADRGALRIAVANLPRVGSARSVACLLTEEDEPAPLMPRPDWPPLARLTARRLASGGALTLVHLQAALSAHLVFRELARVAGTSHPSAERVIVESPGRQRQLTLPPEIVVRPDSTVPVQEYAPDLAPTPLVVTDPQLGLGPLDEGLLNPIGFHSEPDQGITELDGAQEVCARTVAELRHHLGVRVDWTAASPQLARRVAALAMAGIPLVGDPPPAATRAWLGAPLADALAEDAEVSDPLRREEHSIRLRRAALLTHSGPGWRTRVAEAAGQPRPRFPTCTVVLATRRPDNLDFALANVARQRGVDVELVVAAHGFTPDAGQVRELLPGRHVEVVNLPQETIFGDVLNAGVAAGSGDIVVKMDDDDFYGPDFLLDLLLAREYSGADLVGTPAEFVYLESLDRTVRRHGTPRDASERFASIVAGGTITIPRGLLRSLGGFQAVHRFVDQQLFHAARSVGATIYRTHGLGFMLRRSSDGHTWTVEDDHFLDTLRLRGQWDGLVKTRILDPDEVETP